MYVPKSNDNKSLEAILKLYSEQLDADSSWFILDSNKRIVLSSQKFYELFGDSNYCNLSLESLSIKTDSYTDLINKINSAIISGIFTESAMSIQLKCGNFINLWVLLQPITVKESVVALLGHIQAVKTPIRLSDILFEKFAERRYTYTKEDDQQLIVKSAVNSQNNSYKFTKSEEMILNLILAGFSQKGMCQKLNLSRTRLTQYIARLCNKCGYTGYSGKSLKHHFNSLKHS